MKVVEESVWIEPFAKVNERASRALRRLSNVVEAGASAPSEMTLTTTNTIHHQARDK